MSKRESNLLETYDILNDPVLEGLGKLDVNSKSIKEIESIVSSEEEKFKQAMERQTLSAEDNLRCFNL